MSLFPSTWILLAVLVYADWSVAVEFDTLYEWMYIDYVWETDAQKQEAVTAGEYNYENIIPVDFQKISGDRVLITTPKYRNNPASLSIISNQTGEGGPLLEPYPSWDWHRQGNCSGMTSVNRVIVDKCDRLWIVDSGKIVDDQICPAQIFAFNTTTDELLEQVEIPDRLSHSSTDSSQGWLEIQFVETQGDSCENTWVYIGDPQGYGIVIWDGSDIWRLENDDIFAPNLLASSFIVGLEVAYIPIGVSLFTMPPPGFVDDDYLLFKPTSSLVDYAAKVEDLHNSKTGSSVPYWKGTIILPTQELVRVFSDSGVLVAGLSTGSLVACYYVENPLALTYVGIPVSDPVRMQFGSAGKIIKGENSTFEEESYWQLSNRLQKFVLGTMSFDEINFRIMSVNIAELIEGYAVCQPGTRTVQTIEEKYFFEHGSISTVIL